MSRTPKLAALTVEELERQQAVELPARDLMIMVSVLGIPVVGVTGLNLSLGVS